MSIFEYDEEKHEKCIRKEAFEDGKLSFLVELVCRKLVKNKTPEIIADELEEDLETIRLICETVIPYAPDYDIEEIVAHLQNENIEV